MTKAEQWLERERMELRRHVEVLVRDLPILEGSENQQSLSDLLWNYYEKLVDGVIFYTQLNEMERANRRAEG